MGLEKEMMGEGLPVSTKCPVSESELRARANVLKRSKELFIESPALHSLTWFFLVLARTQGHGARACGEWTRLVWRSDR